MFRKALFSIVRVADGHVENGFGQPIELVVRVGHDQICQEGLEATRRQRRDARLFMISVVILHKMVLTLKFAVYPRNLTVGKVEDVAPWVVFGGKFGLLIETLHFLWCDDQGVFRFVILNL